MIEEINLYGRKPMEVYFLIFLILSGCGQAREW